MSALSLLAKISNFWPFKSWIKMMFIIEVDSKICSIIYDGTSYDRNIVYES